MVFTVRVKVACIARTATSEHILLETPYVHFVDKYCGGDVSRAALLVYNYKKYRSEGQTGAADGEENRIILD